MKYLPITLIILLGMIRVSSGQNVPSGNDNQGGVGASPGTYSVTPSAATLNAYTANATRVVENLNTHSVSSVGLAWIRYNDTRPTGESQWLGVGGNWRHSFQWDFALTTVNSVPAIQVRNVIRRL